ncbi:MAG: hypothetical protein AAF798_19045 [Bacteroidota bacterium]
MKKIFLLLLITLGPYSMCEAQVTISPVAGFSYSPFTVLGIDATHSSSRIDYVLGVSGNIPIHKKWSLSANVSYVDREDMKWSDKCFCPGYLYDRFTHSDLNLDFDVNYEIKSWLLLGIGPSITKKLNVRSIIKYDNFQGENLSVDQSLNIPFQYGYNIAIQFLPISRLNIRLEYAARIGDDRIQYPRVIGSTRYSLLFSYSLVSIGKQR